MDEIICNYHADSLTTESEPSWWCGWKNGECAKEDTNKLSVECVINKNEFFKGYKIRCEHEGFIKK
jgi:hypothetical protein